jgi:hypothetical protein
MPTGSLHPFPMKPFDPREQSVVTPESVDAAIDAANAERLQARRQGCAVTLVPYPHDAEPFDRAVAMSLVDDLIHVWGAKRVASWVRNLAAIHGEEV